MSHMAPVSGTDIDLFIEGIILGSLHLEYTHRAGLNVTTSSYVMTEAGTPPTCPPVNELE